MTKEELLRRIDAFATPRYGVKVTDRMLRDWVAAGLVPGPTAHGRRRGESPEWVWSALAYRRTLQVCRLKKHGLTRNSAIVAGLWLCGALYPFPLVRDSVLKEYRRLRLRLTRNVPSGWDPRTGRSLPPRSRAAVLRGIGFGEPDPFGGLHFSEEFVLEAAASLLFGLDPAHNVHGLVGELVTSFGIDAAAFADVEQTAPLDWDREVEPLIGLGADPDDTDRAAETTITSSDAATFENARRFATVWPWMTGLLPAFYSLTGASLPDAFAQACRAFAQSTKEPPIRLFTFIVFLRRAEAIGDKGHGMGQAAQLMLRPMKRLLTFIENDPPTRALLIEELGGVSPADLMGGLIQFSQASSELDERARRQLRCLVRPLWKHGLGELCRQRPRHRPC